LFIFGKQTLCIQNIVCDLEIAKIIYFIEMTQGNIDTTYISQKKEKAYIQIIGCG